MKEITKKEIFIRNEKIEKSLTKSLFFLTEGRNA